MRADGQPPHGWCPARSCGSSTSRQRPTQNVQPLSGTTTGSCPSSSSRATSCEFTTSLFGTSNDAYSIMPPGCPHQVLTPVPSIMVGGHFWSPKTLRKAMQVGMWMNKSFWRNKYEIRDSNASHDHAMIAVLCRHVLTLLAPWEQVMSAWRDKPFKSLNDYDGKRPKIYPDDKYLVPWTVESDTIWVMVALALAAGIWVGENDDKLHQNQRLIDTELPEYQHRVMVFIHWWSMMVKNQALTNRIIQCGEEVVAGVFGQEPGPRLLGKQLMQDFLSQ